MHWYWLKSNVTNNNLTNNETIVKLHLALYSSFAVINRENNVNVEKFINSETWILAVMQLYRRQ